MSAEGKKNLIRKIMEKKEFSELPKADVELAFSKFEKRQTSDEDKIKLTRNLLREVFSGFASEKLLSPKDKKEEWVLRKHLSTRERLGKFEEIYSRILKGLNGELSIIDLGAGANGFSYKYFGDAGYNVEYVAVEAVGQLVTLMNSYFKREKLPARAHHESLFQLAKIKQIVSKTKKPRVVFLFKTLDSLEMIERDYSKKLLKGIVPLCDRVVVSFATESMHARKKFHAKRTWLLDFIKNNFNILEDFTIRGERFIVFENHSIFKSLPFFWS